MAHPILLVDDDPTIIQFVSTVLKMGGYDVVAASDGSQALELAERDQQIELVLSDIIMPGMTGVQLCEKLKRSRPELKCILMSGYDMGLMVADQGAHFLSKPFFPNDLLRKVREVLTLPSC